MISCPSKILNQPPPIGSVITVKYGSLYKDDTLRNPFYWKQRFDIQWSSISRETRELVFFCFSFIQLLVF